MKRLALLAIMAVAVMAIPGCGSIDAFNSAALGYASGEVATQKTNIQHTNDLAAQTLSDTLCTVSIGELARNGSGNPNFPSAVLTNCGVPSGYTFIHTVPTAQATKSVPTDTQTASPQGPVPAPSTGP